MPTAPTTPRTLRNVVTDNACRWMVNENLNGKVDLTSLIEGIIQGVQDLNGMAYLRTLAFYAREAGQPGKTEEDAGRAGRSRSGDNLPRRLRFSDLDTAEYDSILQAFDDRAVAAEAALSLEKALQPIRADAFRDKLWDILSELCERQGFYPDSRTIKEYINKIVEAY